MCKETVGEWWNGTESPATTVQTTQHSTTQQHYSKHSQHETKQVALLSSWITPQDHIQTGPENHWDISLGVVYIDMNKGHIAVLYNGSSKRIHLNWTQHKRQTASYVTASKYAKGDKKNAYCRFPILNQFYSE